MTITKQDLIDMNLHDKITRALCEFLNRIEALESKSTRMKKPTLAEVQLDMKSKDCINFMAEGESFINYFESVGWVVGKAQKPMKKWKAAVNNWLKNPSNGSDRQAVSKGLRDINKTNW